MYYKNEFKKLKVSAYVWLLYIVMSCRKVSPSPVTGCANTWQDVLLMKANPLIPNQPNEFRKSHTHKDWLIMSKKRKEMPPSNPSYLRTPSCVSMATLAQPLTDFSPSVYQFKQRWLPTKYRIIRTNADGGFPVVFLLPCYLFLFLGSYTLWPVPLKPSSLGGRKQQTRPSEVWCVYFLLLVFFLYWAIYEVNFSFLRGRFCLSKVTQFFPHDLGLLKIAKDQTARFQWWI